MVDASPLIYLAKLDALDVFAGAGLQPLVTPQVERETARTGLSYVYTDASLIAEALRSGLLQRTELTDKEAKVADRLTIEAGGLDRGEAEVLAAAAARSLPALLYERRALRLARSLGVVTWSPPDLIALGTPNRRLARDRTIRFARLVDMRFEELEQLLVRIEDEHD
jgi:predicted nucleic acid-binding protein